ncbi:MAG: DNA alkylation repair protein [Gemmatimonadaceae bacterium]
MSAELKPVMASLERAATKATRDGMLRYGIPNDHAIGVTMGSLKVIAKKLGRDHALADALWKTKVYEARLLATLVDEPERVTAAQMDRWCRDFDNWGICDTACFALFDRTAHAWKKVEQWSSKKGEFQKRASFALLWSLSVHDKSSGDAPFLRGLELVEGAADDDRTYVRKAVNMALRAVGKRNRALNIAAVRTSRALAAGDGATARWIGKDALRELTSAGVTSRLPTGKGTIRPRGSK